ncbi:hypothetical protein HanIR_Chr09g0394021 [Helianthus annuus]|nr:hypothetical protein HanIR_Chr09g0394021 [Helianthus annuus]
MFRSVRLLSHLPYLSVRSLSCLRCPPISCSTRTLSFPDELKALLNQKFAFKIAIGSFNIKNKSDGYSVSKLTENPLVISVLDKKFDDIQPVDVDGHVGYPWHYSLVVSWGWDKAYDH